MSSVDYLAAVSAGASSDRIPDDAAPWDPELVAAINSTGVLAFEEDLLGVLLDDIRHGVPGISELR